MCKWLGYGTQNEKSAADNLLCRREFSFTIAEDVYIRYLSYENADALRKVRPNPNAHPKEVPVIVPRRKHHDAFCAQGLCDQLPHKIDIGAVFTADPRDHKKFKLFEPVQREFLIDIDLTDYEFLDCDVKKIETCDRCWPIMALAARALNQILVKDFGFEHLLFVYSGRRGIHCWVCDTRARVMPNDVRSAVADYLSPKLNAATGRLSIAQPMHPSLRRSMAEAPPLAVPEVGPLASSVPAWQLWLASKPHLQNPASKPRLQSRPLPISRPSTPLGAARTTTSSSPSSRRPSWGASQRAASASSTRRPARCDCSTCSGTTTSRPVSSRAGVGGPAPRRWPRLHLQAALSLHPACAQPAPSLHPRPLPQHTPPPHSPPPLQALLLQTLLPQTPSARPRPLQALPCTRAGPSSSAAVGHACPHPTCPHPGCAQSGLEKWNNLVKHVHGKKNRALSSVLDEIIFSYTFPRLDVNVSKGMNHLLKSPWACHPKTGRVCVPIDAAMADKFEPWTVWP
jgi:DNA primase catalytic subunit